MLSGHGKLDNRGCTRHCRPVTSLNGWKAQRDVTSPVVRPHDTDAPHFLCAVPRGESGVSAVRAGARLSARREVGVDELYGPGPFADGGGATLG